MRRYRTLKPTHSYARYATVGQALLQTLAQGLGDGFVPEVKAAWTEVYGVLAGAMMTAAAAAEPAPAAPLLSTV